MHPARLWLARWIRSSSNSAKHDLFYHYTYTCDDITLNSETFSRQAHYPVSAHQRLHTCSVSPVLLSVSTTGESNTLLVSAPLSPADGVLSFCNESFNVLVNFSNDLEHVLSFTSYKNPRCTNNVHILNRVLYSYMSNTPTGRKVTAQTARSRPCAPAHLSCLKTAISHHYNMLPWNNLKQQCSSISDVMNSIWLKYMLWQQNSTQFLPTSRT